MKLSEIFDVHYTTILEAEDKHMLLDVNKSVLNCRPKTSDRRVSVPTSNSLTTKEQDILMAFRLLSDESQKDVLEFISKKFKGDRNLG